MTDISIPDEALEAVNRVLNLYLAGGYTQSDEDTVARAACLAMLKHWPGMVQYPVMEIDCEEGEGL